MQKNDTPFWSTCHIRWFFWACVAWNKPFLNGGTPPMKQRGVVSKPAKQIEDGLGTETGGDVLNVAHKDAMHTITTYYNQTKFMMQLMNSVIWVWTSQFLYAQTPNFIISKLDSWGKWLEGSMIAKCRYKETWIIEPCPSCVALLSKCTCRIFLEIWI